MKGLITVFLLSLPAVSQAMGMYEGPGKCDPMVGNLIASALFAVIAALGYWVLQHADKETHNCVKRTGWTVGGLLVVIGLLGFLCGVAAHIKKAAPCRACHEVKCEEEDNDSAEMKKEMPMLPPGHPPVEQSKKPAAAAKKNGK